MNALAENYYTLALCLLSDMAVEQALKYYSLEADRPRVTGKEKQTEEMLRLRQQGMSYEQIGNMYGLTRATVYTRLKKYTGRVEICCR